MPQRFPAARQHPWGYGAILLGALALSIALLNIIGGPFSPAPTIGEQIGEIAADIRASALRELSGAEAPPETAQGWDIDRIMLVAAPLTGVAAVLTAIISVLGGDPHRLPLYGAALGASAIVIQFVWWAVMIIAAAIIIAAVIENIGGIFGV